MIVPRIPSTAWGPCLGLIGAVIMPHNLYLHSSLVLTRKINIKNRNHIREANIYNSIESAVSLFISFVISTCVIATFAVYIEKHPEKTDLDLQSASAALAETFGESAKYIWAIGLLAAGQSSTMTGTYAGQFVMEGFLDFKLPVWQRVLITRSVAIVPALLVLFLDFGDDKILTNMDTWLNILQSVQLPFAIVPTIKFASSPLIMGEFAMSKASVIFASLFGIALFLMNFVILFVGGGITHVW
jgi:NRAMP (natural resistance-associated macrophage protein)-like metal ion transporter